MRKKKNPQSDTNQAFEDIWSSWLKGGNLQEKIDDHIKQRAPFLTFLRKQLDQLKEGGKVLEIGVGTAIDSAYLARCYPKLHFVGSDLSEKSVILAQKTIKQMKVKMELVVDDATDSRMKDRSFDLIFSQGVVEHFPDSSRIMQEQVRLLKEGGILVTDVPQKFNPYTIYKHKEIKKNTWPYGWETEYSTFSLKKLGRDYGLLPIDEMGYGYGYHQDYGFSKIESLGKRFERKLPWIGFVGRFYDQILHLLERKWGKYFMLSVVVVFKKPNLK